MVIYIDVLLFTNTLINYCILSVVKKFLHLDVKIYRLIISSIVSALFSLTVFMKEQTILISLIIKLICTVIMCIIAFGFKKTSSLVKKICTTYIVSIVFCGSMILIHSTLKPKNMAIINDMVYFDIKPIALIVLSVTIYFTILLIQRIFSEDICNTLVNLKIIIDNNEFSCIGKIDTGCSVTEPFSNAPVIITESSILNNNILKKCNRVIPYNALGITSTLSGIKADKVFVDKKAIDKEIYIGVYKNKIDNTIKAIINSNIIR